MAAEPDHSLRPPPMSDAAVAFLERRLLATLTTLRADGSPHVVPVGFTYDTVTGTARVITSRTSVKVANLRERPWAALCQVEGREWITLEGAARILEDDGCVADAVRSYAARYRPPRPNPERVVVEIRVVRVLSASGLRRRADTTDGAHTV